jgi:hypothetical protein
MKVRLSSCCRLAVAAVRMRRSISLLHAAQLQTIYSVHSHSLQNTAVFTRSRTKYGSIIVTRCQDDKTSM